MIFKNKFKSLSMLEAQKNIEKNKNILILDVRTKEEYNFGHIPNSINVPLNIILTAQSLNIEKDAEIYVYCHSGARSRSASERLSDLGYENITNIGGILNWPGKIQK